MPGVRSTKMNGRVVDSVLCIKRGEQKIFAGRAARSRIVLCNEYM
jgi:hypothetical protein